MLLASHSPAKEDFVFRKTARSSARLRWVLEYSKHRRTTACQRGFRGSSLEKSVSNLPEARMVSENRSFEVVRQAAIF